MQSKVQWKTKPERRDVARSLAAANELSFNVVQDELEWRFLLFLLDPDWLWDTTVRSSFKLLLASLAPVAS